MVLQLDRRTGGLEIRVRIQQAPESLDRRTGGLEKMPLCRPIRQTLDRRTGGLEKKSLTPLRIYGLTAAQAA